jgi:large subunit ribosomal protein L30
MMAKRLRVKLVRSPIGYSVRQKRTVEALGLRKMHQTVEHPDNPAVRGMVGRVSHLVEVEEVEV